MTYTKEVMKNFLHPKNMGEIKNPDAVGEVGNPACGDVMKIYLKINKEKNTIEDIKFKTFGCAAAIATSSMITQIAKGEKIEDAKKITTKKIIQSLKGLPKIKIHCSNLAEKTLKKAIKNYENKIE